MRIFSALFQNFQNIILRKVATLAKLGCVCATCTPPPPTLIYTFCLCMVCLCYTMSHPLLTTTSPSACPYTFTGELSGALSGAGDEETGGNGGEAGSGPLVTNQNVHTNLLLVALLDHLSVIYVQDEAQSNQLYKGECLVTMVTTSSTKVSVW